MVYNYETADPILYKLLKDYAKRQRQNPTIAERVLWEYLKRGQLGQPFRKQHIIGEFIADFICLPVRLIIEVDGGYHAERTQQEDDAIRQRWLEEMGYTVIRFSNEAILVDIKTAIDTIMKYLRDPKSSP